MVLITGIAYNYDYTFAYQFASMRLITNSTYPSSEILHQLIKVAYDLTFAGTHADFRVRCNCLIKAYGKQRRIYLLISTPTWPEGRTFHTCSPGIHVVQWLCFSHLTKVFMLISFAP